MGITSSVSPTQRITPSPPSRAVFVLLAINCINKRYLSANTSLIQFLARVSTLFFHQAKFFYFISFLSLAIEVTHTILLSHNNPPLTMSRQRPPDPTILQLFRADLSREGAIRFVKNILRRDFDALA